MDTLLGIATKLAQHYGGGYGCGAGWSRRPIHLVVSHQAPKRVSVVDLLEDRVLQLATNVEGQTITLETVAHAMKCYACGKLVSLFFDLWKVDN